MSPQILIVGTQPAFVSAIAGSLQGDDSIDVLSAATGREALSTVGRETLDAVILEADLPDASGFDVAESIRRQRPEVPIMFLTNRDSHADKLAGFGAGADDYVVKPFSPLELAARLRALVRRAQTQSDSPKESYDFGDFEVRPEEGRLLVGTEEVVLPAREFQLLCFLARRQDTVFSASELYSAVWGVEAMGVNDHNTVSVHVHRLRAKIEPVPADPRHLVTVRGLGYKLARADAAAEWAI